MAEERGALGAAFEAVQEKKRAVDEDALTPELAEMVKRKLRAELGEHLRDDRVQQLYEITVGGMAWVAKMLADHDLSFVEAWGIGEVLADSVKNGMSGTGYTPEQGIEAGVGAGFYTGMWVGFELAGENPLQ